MINRLLFAVTLVGCTTSLGRVGAIAPSPEHVGTKMLRPGVVGRSCAADVFGIPIRGDERLLDRAVAQILDLDAEGNVVVNADVSSSAVVTGIYNRRCIKVRGDLARTISTVTLPAPPGHHGHH
jgi:hypothetical protein